MNKTINQICQSFNQNWEISAEGKEQWILSFFIKAKFNNLTKELMLAKLNNFYQTDLSEASFKKCFQEILSKNYYNQH